jgi:hypothetical protein
MKGGGRLATAALVVAALAPFARAEDLVWKLEGATARYDLAVDTRPTPAPPMQPAFVPVLLLRQADLRDGRVPTRRIEDVGDLVWHYALVLPAGDVPARGLDAPIDDTHQLANGFDVKATGTHSVHVRAHRAQIRTQFALSGTGASAWLKTGTLVVERTLSPKGRLELAQWTLELEVQPPVAQGQPAVVAVRAKWAGRITPGEELDPVARDFQGRVQQSIDRGVDALMKSSTARLNAAKTAGFQSQALGEVALHTFALLRSGVSPAQLEDRFTWMDTQPFKETYSVALYLMALEARSVERLRLPPSGGMRSVARFDRHPSPPADKERMRQAALWLIGARKIGEGWWSYGGRPVEPGTRERREGPLPVGPMQGDGTTAAAMGDRSNSQFAILALHAAMAAQIDIPPELWEEVLAELVMAQETPGVATPLDGTEYGSASPLAFDARDVPLTGSTTERLPSGLPTQERGSGMARGWGYSTHVAIGASGAYGSMSGAGLSSVAIAREGLLSTHHLTGDRDRQTLLVMRDGLCWFARNWDPARNPFRSGAWYYYYLYSIEKAMDLCGIERVGSHEWWRDGASELLSRQTLPAGNWEGANETALALLFLNRATLPARLDVAARVATGADDPSSWDKVVVQGTGQVSVRQVLAALVTADPTQQRDRLELAQAALAGMDALLRPRVLPELSQLSESSNAKVKKWAADECQALAGSTEPAAITAFCARYEALRRAWELHDLTQVPMVQGVLTDVQASAQLKRAALLAVGRMRAIEALGEVIAQLDHRDQPLREQAWQTLLSMAGREVFPYDPAAAQPARRKQIDLWRGWWAQDGPPLVQGELARRLVDDLAVEAKAADAVKALRAIGRPAVRPLIDGLRNPASKTRAHSLLQELTGQKLPAELDKWLAWWGDSQVNPDAAAPPH